LIAGGDDSATMPASTPTPAPPPDDFTTHVHNGVTIVSLQVNSLLGILDVNRVGGTLTALVEGGVKKLILDLRKIEFAGSAALGMLMALSGELRSQRGQLVLAGTQHIDPLLKVTRARSMFEIAPDVDAAMAKFA
jgi:anti-anti-sigma factor